MVTSVAQFVKNLPAMQETWAPSLDQEDPLEKHMATHASTLAWRIPWADKPGGLQSMELPRDTTEATNTHTHTHTLVTLVLDLLQIKGGLSIPHDPDPLESDFTGIFSISIAAWRYCRFDSTPLAVKLIPQ